METWLPWVARALPRLPNPNGRMPVAPLSCQQAAARYEVSAQQMVCGLGGHTVGELEAALEERWAYRFRVSKVWRAWDAISDTGVYRLLEHHWLVFLLEPVAEASSSTAPAELGSKRPAPVPAEEGRPKARRSSSGASAPDAAPDADAAKQEGPSSPAYHERAEQGSPRQDGAAVRADAAEQRTEQPCQPAPPQEAGAGPAEETGWALAEAGEAWFLRVDRFDTADKWFACASLADALQTQQARERHYRPDSLLVLQVLPGRHPLFLDCLLPLLRRLESVPYSVFAKGSHCQWHARTLACLAASAQHLLDPGSVAADPPPQVSPILTDGRVQQRFTEVAASLAQPDGAAAAFVRQRPEAPFLKGCIADLQALAAAHPGRLPAALADVRLPDLHFIYTALQTSP